MNLSHQDSLPFNSHATQLHNNGVMIVLGYYLGLGALIQSTVNSIWLAQKLNKRVYIWWGKSCFYTDKLLEGNTYSKVFQEPYDHTLNLDLEREKITPKILCVYPTPWQSIAQHLTVEKIDIEATNLASSNNLELNSPERIVKSDICIVYQYLLSDFALNTVHSLGVFITKDQFLDECNIIFKKYFQPHPRIKISADALWSQLFTANQKLVIGLHLRGTDKVIEKPVPSPRKYLSIIKKMSDFRKASSFFIATDSEPYLQKLKSSLKSSYIGYQDIERSKGLSPLHYKLSGSGDGFANGVAMIIDIELLSRCQIVLAFPGSQIFWWLSRKQAGENLPFSLQAVNPDLIDWVSAGYSVLRSHGLKAFIRFLRYQKHRLMHDYKEKFKKK